MAEDATVTNPLQRPAWAKEGDVVKEWTSSGNQKYMVPSSVYHALTTPFRGQKGWASQQSSVVKFMTTLVNETPTLNYSPFRTDAPSTNDVVTVFTLKSTGLQLGNGIKVGGLNSTKLADKILKVADVVGSAAHVSLEVSAPGFSVFVT